MVLRQINRLRRDLSIWKYDKYLDKHRW